MAKTPFDSELVRSLAALLDETNLSEVEYEYQGMRVRVARQITVGAAMPMAMPAMHAAPPVATAQAQPQAPAAAPAAVDLANHPGTLKSPMVGVAYLAQEPGAPRFAAIGDSVTEGQTLLLIEAMKTYNPIKAHKSGKLTSVLVDDGQPVEYGEPLAVIE